MSAPYTLAELLSPENLDAVRARVLAAHQGAGFPALTQWVPKAGVEMSYVDMLSGVVADKIAADLPDAVASGFLGKATDGYADLLAERVYLNTRRGASKTSFNLDLVCAETAGPYSLELEDVEVRGASGLRYRNSTRGDVAAGAFVTMTFEAAEAGAAYNDNPEVSVPILVTTQAGLTVRVSQPAFSAIVNTGSGTGRLVPTAAGVETPEAHTYQVRIDAAGDPGTAKFSLAIDGGPFGSGGVLNASTSLGHGVLLAAFPGGGSPASFQAGDVYTFTAPGGSGYVQGSDAEPTSQLMQRCRGRFSTLSLNPTDGLFHLWAVLAYQAASRVKVSPDLVVAGRTLLTVADTHGPLDAVGVARITAYIAPKLRGLLDGVLVEPARSHPFGASGFVLVDPTRVGEVQAAAQALFTKYVGELEIGAPVKIAFIEDLLMDAGAVDVTDLQLSDADGSDVVNIDLAANEVAVPEGTVANLFTWIFA